MTNAVDDAVNTMAAAINEIADLRKERDDWKGRYDTLLAIWKELVALRREASYRESETLGERMARDRDD